MPEGSPAAAPGRAAALGGEDQQLKLKFRSLTYTAAKREQKLREVTDDQKGDGQQQSYKLWKRLNPGYYEAPTETAARSAQHYTQKDFENVDKTRFRVKDKHTEYVEYVVRDKALARANKK